MRKAKLHKYEVNQYLISALKEDIPVEDISTKAIYRDEREAIVSVIMKEDGIICGLDVFSYVFQLLDENVKINKIYEDGDYVEKGKEIATVQADVSVLLSGERVALNYLQRMSGIATYTHQAIENLDDPRIKLLDTRKTTPNMRIFEKYAVKIGGGENHRFNLSDLIMLKDNHIAASGGIKNAIHYARDYKPFVKKIEIEVESLEQVREAVDEGADIIMLDNMDIATIKEACKIINKKSLIEISGNITRENISKYKGVDVDFLSSGAITYMANPLDISIKNLRYV
ncbi:MAG: carboxylating nicotinate-nucleotide diphosphorylase [Anaerococcus sp.]|nr:carboxylating nicotinate-nucleotide diphosphorylase [Anaerococcus sp.]MDD7044859.1 carboxylating nicotinate-nucleotide diphosphorylase [Peptoniphilaceae bacterium]MDY2918336.1 carboxylating nicotinate-nucleotide diphosphorylase [Anaerococcus sp.]